MEKILYYVRSLLGYTLLAAWGVYLFAFLFLIVTLALIALAAYCVLLIGLTLVETVAPKPLRVKQTKSTTPPPALAQFKPMVLH